MLNSALRITGYTVFAVAWCVLFTQWIGRAELVVSHDALQYSEAAANLATRGFYSFDGIQPYIEREPGFSTFLAPIYFLFGKANLLAVFLAQGALYLVASYVFCREIARRYGMRVASACTLLLLTFPGALRAIFMLYRESVALSLFMLFASAFLWFLRTPTWRSSLVAGLLMSALILTYYSFFFLPLFLLPLLLLLWRPQKKYIALFFVASYALVCLWGVRNMLQDGRFRVIDSFRTTVMWHVRAEQAEHVTGTEPFMCLWAEYISRNWNGRSHACSTTGVFHQKWPHGVPLGNEAQIAQEGQMRILRHLPSYLWFSVAEVVELHLPFVGGGWPFWFHLLAAIGSVLLYIGVALSLFSRGIKSSSFFLAVLVYGVCVFSLTDATPRYLVPTIFCYALLASVGYTEAFSRITRRA